MKKYSMHVYWVNKINPETLRELYDYFDIGSLKKQYFVSDFVVKNVIACAGYQMAEEGLNEEGAREFIKTSLEAASDRSMVKDSRPKYIIKEPGFVKHDFSIICHPAVSYLISRQFDGGTGQINAKIEGPRMYWFDIELLSAIHQLFRGQPDTEYKGLISIPELHELMYGRPFDHMRLAKFREKVLDSIRRWQGFTGLFIDDKGVEYTVDSDFYLNFDDEGTLDQRYIYIKESTLSYIVGKYYVRISKDLIGERYDKTQDVMNYLVYRRNQSGSLKKVSKATLNRVIGGRDPVSKHILKYILGKLPSVEVVE